MYNTEEAIIFLRKHSAFRELIRDSYLDENVMLAAERFCGSAEFSEILNVLGNNIENKVILDLGAGPGIASFSFARNKAKHVYSIDPDLSHHIGCGAAVQLSKNLPFSVICANGENIPLGNDSIDIIYMRQVLHHVKDLGIVLNECARILKSGGLLLATREHVINNKRQLRKFLANHPVHRLTGGENAYRLDEYINAIKNAGGSIEAVIGPIDSIINAFPKANSSAMLGNIHTLILNKRFGVLGVLISKIPGVKRLIRIYLNNAPGRQYSFLGRF